MSSESSRRAVLRRKKRYRTTTCEDEDRLRKEDELRAKNLKLLEEKPDMERCLEDLVFGGEEEFVEALLVDTKRRDEPSRNVSSDSEEDHVERVSSPEKTPAWVDDDDAVDESVEMTHRYRRDIQKSKDEATLSKEKLQTRLREEFQKAMGGVQSWASLEHRKKKAVQEGEDEDDVSEDEDNLLSRTGNLLTKSSHLPKGVLEVKKCLSANHERLSKVPLTSVQFHPMAQVVMTAGGDRTISLFQVDGRLNPKIQSIHLEKFPIISARFSADGEQVIATGKWQQLFYIYDMMGGSITPYRRIRGLNEKSFKQFEVSPDGSFLLFSGSAGYLHLLSMKTKELIGSMKMNGNSVKAAFTPDCSKIVSNSDEGLVYIWDVKSRRCLNKFADDGSIRGTSLALSKDGRYLSCGSNSGVVNIYNYEDCLQTTNPKPLRSVMNLVTTASSMVFNQQTEILAVASNKMDDAVKLMTQGVINTLRLIFYTTTSVGHKKIHVPSFTVFSNFPTQSNRKTIHLPLAMDFSPHCGFFSIANNKGEALLYRLKHYTDF